PRPEVGDGRGRRGARLDPRVLTVLVLELDVMQVLRRLEERDQQLLDRKGDTGLRPGYRPVRPRGHAVLARAASDDATALGGQVHVDGHHAARRHVVEHGDDGIDAPRLDRPALLVRDRRGGVVGERDLVLRGGGGKLEVHWVVADGGRGGLRQGELVDEDRRARQHLADGLGDHRHVGEYRDGSEGDGERT